MIGKPVGIVACNCKPPKRSKKEKQYVIGKYIYFYPISDKPQKTITPFITNKKTHGRC